MSMIPVFALMLAPNPPVPINEAQMRDIGCVAAIGIIAHEQRSGMEALSAYADVRETGKRWAGIVGERVMQESGQPREVVAFAIKQAVEAEQARAMQMEDTASSAAYVRGRFDECAATMEAQLAAADASTPAATVDNSASMLAPEPEWQTDEPDKVALYRSQLGEDLASPQRIRFCDGMISAAYLEIAGREGFESRDAKAFGQLAAALEAKVLGLRDDSAASIESAGKMFDTVKTEADREQQVGRCIRLAESLALAMPPE